MALVVRLGSTDDLAEIVEALLAAADTRANHAPAQAERWRTLAHDFGDALDQLPQPTP
ncbi:hypothetical protein [Streptomyces europaeiscabiei]|uniref:hypothetical protein n=1 Tax=Streptomyces europaeiscabiei TaxID=146819 RepID=UPI000A75E9C3|nr:hypothetical protein [Streptomyces europaeiscabiei]MDX3831357.1 hypothetical protein [Streptomyces europaeiscabiei]